MKYYGERTNKLYNTEKECMEAEFKAKEKEINLCIKLFLLTFLLSILVRYFNCGECAGFAGNTSRKRGFFTFESY